MEFNLDGIDLTSDTAKADILASVAKHVLGLKNKNADLIKREADAKDSLDEYKIDAEKEKHTAAKELAEKNGSIEDYKVALQNEKDAMINLEATFQQEKDGRVLSDSVNDFSSVLADDPAGRMYMQSQFSSLVEVKDGVVVPKDVTTKLEDLKQSLITDKANAKYIKANVGSGLGSVGSEHGFSSVKSLKDMTATEEAALANSDPALYNSLLTK